MNKTIVILSDGTGNSASKPFKTNVWRLYQALDLTRNQVAFYSDGVGNENFKPLRYLGLAFGFGLAGIIKELYTFLCRNYQPGDRIFLFGFSRGAFAVRILAGLIARCGVVACTSEAELSERVTVAYNEYKRDSFRRATATRPWLLIGQFLRFWDRQWTNNVDHIRFNFVQHFPDISFIGIWDTVDAYVMPIDGLKLAIDKYVWPMTLADRELSPYIEAAYQALSIDDERPTFRPVLWNVDQRELLSHPVAPFHPRLTQVWFAGVHANVGGGYPDDGLSHVALLWILDAARAHGLHFNTTLYQTYRDAMNVHGKQYDSRSGVAGYYRYGPRQLDAICRDDEHGVNIGDPTLHPSVYYRIHEWRVAYTPVGVPLSYNLWDPINQIAHPFENCGQAESRMADMALVHDAIFKRRIAYFTMVFLTALLAFFPLFDHYGLLSEDGTRWLTIFAVLNNGAQSSLAHLQAILPPSIAENTAIALESGGWLAGWLVGAANRSLQTVLEALFSLAPSWTTWWQDSFKRHPIAFLIVSAMLAWLFFKKSSQLQRQMVERADYAWRLV